MRQLQKFSEKKKKLYHVFVDLGRAFDRVPRKAIDWALRRQKVPERLVVTVMSLYVESRSKVKTGRNIRLLQHSSRSAPGIIFKSTALYHSNGRGH